MMTAQNQQARTTSGFTLVEMMLTMGIIAILATISSLLLTGLIPKASLVSASEQMIAEIRQHQFKAMIGDSLGSGAQARSKGIKIESNQYIFFEGDTFNPSSATNYTIAMEEPLSLGTNFGNQVVVFEKGSGEILNYQPNSATITIQNSSNNQAVSIKFNAYGVITEIN